jgi:polyvinyl alcohol dehydrogenase (cytochrome)
VEELEDRSLLSGTGLTVMSYNLFQGSELTQALTVPSLAQLPAAVSSIEAEVAATGIPGRAASWAREVAAPRPDVLALQEASLWRIHAPSSAIGGQAPALTVQYDFIGSLITDLASMGLEYTVVGTINGADVQAPDLEGNNFRLTDRVALLARADEPPGQLSWNNIRAAAYDVFPVAQVGGPGGLTVPVRNGWVSADFTKNGETVRVITTHLDAAVPAINGAQAVELINGPANTTLPVVVMGDLNSPADNSGSPAHQEFLAAGFNDAWTATNPTAPGYTAQPHVNLTSSSFDPSQRIDYVFLRNGISTDSISLQGTNQDDRTALGLWPSDHAAIAAALDLPRCNGGNSGAGRSTNNTFTVTNLNDSGPGSLRQAIMNANANPGAAIDFAPGLHGTITLTTGELLITGTVSINGPGPDQLAVSGNDASRAFDIAGGSVTIVGLTISHGLADKSAPVFAGTGGAILNLGALTLSNDVLSANEAVGDVSVSLLGSPGMALGGGITNLGALIVSGSMFTNNRVQGADGARSALGAAGLALGGGIENAGALIVTNSTITGNQAQGGSGCTSNFYPGNAGGGGLSNDQGAMASVTYNQFSLNLARGGDNNTSAASGAGIAGGGALEDLAGTLTVAGCTFSSNQAIGGNGNVSAFLSGLGIGGAVKSGSLTTTNPTLVISGSTFSSNQAIGGNGNQVTTPEPSSLGVDNGFGGGLAVFAGTGSISQSALDQNQALGGHGSTGQSGGLGAGGGILAASFAPGVTVTVSGCTVEHNFAIGGPGGSGLGGGLYNDNFSMLTVTASTIRYNQAHGGQGRHGENGAGVGGGIYSLGSVTSNGSTVINNNHASASHDDVFVQATSTPRVPPAPSGGVDVVSSDPNDWPMYTHDPSGSRDNTGETLLGPNNVAGLQVKWAFPTQSAIAGTPAVVNNVVYAADTSGTVYAVTSEGKLLWEHRLTVPMQSPPQLPFTPSLELTSSLLVTRHTIIVGDLGGYIHGLDIITGAELWTIRPNDSPAASIYSSATMVGNDVAIGIASVEELAMLLTPHYVPSFRGSVVLLDPTNGHIIWQSYTISAAERAAGSTGAAEWSTPTYDPTSNTIYVTTGNNYTDPATVTSDAVIALDAVDGHIKWVDQLTQGDVWNWTLLGSANPTDFDFADSPHIYWIGGREVVGAGQKTGFYHVLDAATGAEITSPLQVAPDGLLGGIFADSAVANGVAFINGTAWPNLGGPPLGGSLTAIGGNGSQQLWRTVTAAPNQSGIAVANGVVYFQSLDGNLYAVDAATGKVLATVHTGGYGRESGPSVSRGQVYIGTGDVLDGSFNFTSLSGPGAIICLGIPSNPCGQKNPNDRQQDDQRGPNSEGASTGSNGVNRLAPLSKTLAKGALGGAGVGARLLLLPGSMPEPLDHDNTTVGQQGDQWDASSTSADTALNWDPHMLAALSATLAKETHRGAGDDEILIKADFAPESLDVFNADGSEADRGLLRCHA